MVDYFEVLGIPHSASLTSETVRAAFQSQGAKQHPDAAENAADRSLRETTFQQLNEAFSILTSTPRRLKHLMELRAPGSAKGGVLDESLMALFSQVNSALQQSDALLAKKAGVTSALARALLAGESLQVDEILSDAAGALISRQEALESRLAELDAGGLNDVARLAGAAQEAAFLEKWELQIQQRRLRFME